MKTARTPSQRRTRHNAVAVRSSERPQFKLRLLTLAVLSACASVAATAGQNVHSPLPAGTLPTGGVVSNPATATIVTGTPNLLQINQTAAKTTINWDTFNIGQGSTVRFNQPSASAEAMNYIHDANPTVIQGTLTANGKVYLVNSNGILFDGSAQVNVNTLIASSLNISQTTFNNGITSSLLGQKNPVPVATMVLNNAGQVVNYGTIRSVQVDGPSGQVVNDPTTGQPVESGGTIMLFAPQVENHGVITANNGQVILAAGATVYLQLYNDPTGTGYNANDLSMRGLMVKVTAAPDGALNLSQLIATQNLNSAANIGGEIHSDRGNTTLTGLLVNQSGLVSANTATTVNGSIWLLAQNYDGSNTSYGTLTTGKGSVTETLPVDDGTTLSQSSQYTDNTLYNNLSIPHYQPVIKLVGQNIDHEGTAIAPGGRIEIGQEYVNNNNADRPSKPGRVNLGSNSVLSVAGNWVNEPYSANYLTFKLGSLDLANDPLQKGGFLINQTVTVDTRLPAPLLFDTTSQINNIQRTVQEEATAGGAITVNTGEFISAPGSKVDVSGGGYNYANGMATTTYLVSQGRMYNIETAPIGLQYDGIITQSTPVQGYVQGSNAGLLAIDANQVVMGGSFLGGVTVGPYQRAASALPSPGKMVLGTQSVQVGGTLDFSKVQDGSVVNNLDVFGADYALTNVQLGSGAAIRSQIADALGDIEADPLNAVFPTALKGTLLLPTDLFGGTVSVNASSYVSQGFGSLTIRASGDISVPQGVALNLGVNGSLLWLAPQIDVAGTITAQGGSLTFNKWYDNSLFGTTLLESHCVLSTAGGWVNDSAAVATLSAPDVINAGSVIVGGESTLDAGSQIDVSGGAQLSASGKLTYGIGGSIALPTIALNGVSLLAYSGGTGGVLTLDAGPIDSIDVGGSDPGALSPAFFTTGGFTQYTLKGANVNFLADVHPVANPRIITASAAFAPTGTPFSAISSVRTSVPYYLRMASSLTASSAASTSVNYQLGANQTGITVAPGVTLATDPLGSISLASKTLMDIEGNLSAPGGKISLTLDPGSGFYYDTANDSFNALTIGDHAVISTAGTFLPNTGPAGLTTGQVLPGGAVIITANKNDLNMAQGAVVDVSGSSHVVDLPSGNGYTHANVASAGGSVTINATENAYLDGTFKGNGGEPTVAGGSFALNLLYNGQYTGDAYSQVLNQVAGQDTYAAAALAFMDPSAQQLQHVIEVSQSITPLTHDGSSGDDSLISNLADTTGNFTGVLHANISADQLVNGTMQNGARVGGGFDQVSLNSDNQIQFNPDVSNFAPRALLHLDAPEVNVANGGSVQVGAGSIAGNSWQTGQLEWYNTPDNFRLSTLLPTSLVDQYPLLFTTVNGIKVSVPQVGVQVPVSTQTGNGQLTLAAGQISLAGNVTANGTQNLTLASNGDLRFVGFPAGYTTQLNANDPGPLISTLQALDGRLTSAGNITLQANQIYPATGVNYTVAVESVTFDKLSQNQSISGSGVGQITAVVSRNVISDGQIAIKDNGASSLPPVLSAGGQLTIAADQIDQAGTIMAPLGTINLQGGNSVTLEPGSLTSVSAVWNDNGVAMPLVIPYGATQSVGQTMWYGSVQTNVPPAKQIDISAATVTVAGASNGKPAATVDISGGGDIAAMEFVPGIGGSKDVLTAPNTYAIVPGVVFQSSDSYLNNLAPVSVSGGTPYTMVHLAAGSGLPEGDYALLPAYYALLPGAYLVKAQTGSTYANMIPGTAVSLNDGSKVVAGKLGFSGTDILQSTWSGFSVQSGAEALTGTHAQGQYLVTGSSFFANQASQNGLPAPVLPIDGGQLSIGATGSITAFKGNVLAQAGIDPSTGQPGAIGQVDIYGSQIAIVGNGVVAPTGYTSLSADDLSHLNANLLIGGKRSDTADGQSLDVTASDVLVDLNGGNLTMPELWLVANDNLTVSGGSSLTASGEAVSRAGTLTVNPAANGMQYGALVGLSSGQLLQVARPGTIDTSPTHGNLDIASGAKLTAIGGSIDIDSTGTPNMGGIVNTDTLAIGANHIALGAVPAGSNALTLDDTQLAALGSANNFILRSYSGIDVYGGVNLGQVGTGSLTLDSAGLVGHDVNGTGAPAQLAAGTITLENPSGRTLSDSGDGTGSLTLTADNLVLAECSLNNAGFTVSGFNQVNVNAGQVLLQGKGTLTVAADLNVESARISASGTLVNQQIQAYDSATNTWHAISFTQPATAPALDGTPLPGGQLDVEGKSVDFAGNIALQSGRLTFAAHGSGSTDGVTLESDASIDLSSYQTTFGPGTANLTESADAGRLTLSSENASIAAMSGSSINLDGGSAGGDAGMLTIEADNGTVALSGSLSAKAAAGNQSGSASIDSANLANFSGPSGLNTALQTGGFGQSLYLRARSGDINVTSADTVAAQNVQLVADSGSVNVAGVIDASGQSGGGNVELDAGQGIDLTGKILANGIGTATGVNDAYSNGGTVTLYARAGTLDFASGALIDVSAAASGKSSGGEIVFSAPRTSDETNLQASLNGTVNVGGGSVNVAGGQAPQAGNVILEGFQSYQEVGAAGDPSAYAPITNTSVASSTGSNVYADFNTFMNFATTIHDAALATFQSDVGSANLNLVVRAGVELDGNNITVDSAWDLTDPTAWLPAGSDQAGGRLVLRAASNLAINDRLGLPNDTDLPPTSGWSIQLVGGADMTSADPLAVNASTSQGDVTIGNGVKITTSTGDIQIAAGRDVNEGSATTIYTTGRAVTLPDFMNQEVALTIATPTSSGVNLVDGGGISIAAKGNITGTNNYAAINTWLRRTGQVTTSSALSADDGGFSDVPAYWWVDRAGNDDANTVGVQGIATLGGGDINLVAGGSVSGLTVAVADSRSAAVSATPVLVNNRNNIPSNNAVYGGGNLTVDAGGNLKGGQYLVSRGTARVTAGGQVDGLGGLADTATAPAFWLMGWSDDPALQGAHVQVQALGGTTIGTVANPTMVQLIGNAGNTQDNTTPGYLRYPGSYFSYAADDSFSVQSVSGNLVIVGAEPGSAVANAREVLPPDFSAVALEGSLSSSANHYFNANNAQEGVLGSNASVNLYQYPDSNGQFQLLAAGSIHDLVLSESDYQPGSLATPANQYLATNNYNFGKTYYSFNSPNVSADRMVTPSSLDGYRYAVVADTGNVSNAAFYFPQQSVVQAGADIANVQLDLQDLSAASTSYVTAGRDLYYTNVLSNGTQWGVMPHIQVSGPGELMVVAGRDISLGAVSTQPLNKNSSYDLNNVTRIDATGNTANPSLANADAADLYVVAGVSPGQLSTAQADDLFSVLRSVGQLQGLLGQVQANTLSSTDAISSANAVIDSTNLAIASLFAGPVQPRSTALYESPIKPSQDAKSTKQLTDAYNGALAAANNAIAALFQDGQTHQGDLTMYNARISSATNPGGSGGNLNLLAPFGDIDVGLPSATSKRNIGINTSSGGAINAYLSGDMNVNLSKVATFQGGDILLYTSGQGSTLDAGRGSRSASTTSPPMLVAEKDSNGNLTGKILLLPPLDVSGSGIRTVSYDPDGAGPLVAPAPGKVYLLAPTGFIDAGEAGVSSASGLVVAALAIKNADNFSASGVSVGVPVATTVTAAPVSGETSAASSKMSDEIAQSASSAAAASQLANLSDFRPTFLTVEVLGFGETGSDSGDEQDCKNKKRNDCRK